MNRVSKCPVSEIAGDVHYYLVGNGATVEWDVMGDPRTEVEVCASCAEPIISARETAH